MEELKAPKGNIFYCFPLKKMLSFPFPQPAPPQHPASLGCRSSSSSQESPVSPMWVGPLSPAKSSQSLITSQEPAFSSCPLSPGKDASARLPELTAQKPDTEDFSDCVSWPSDTPSCTVTQECPTPGFPTDRGTMYGPGSQLPPPRRLGREAGHFGMFSS